MQLNNNDNIRYFVPLELVKGGASSDSEMKFRGIASTGSKDQDNENLNQAGLDFSYFLKSGFMNWDHQSKQDPSALVGKPLSANLNKSNQWEIEAKLFSNSTKAKQIYELQQVLEKEGLGLGLSIEGKVIKRGSDDPNNPNFYKVEKALITGCAITPNPKNADTIVNIVKGEHFDDDFRLDIEKSMSAFENAKEEENEKALGKAMDSATGAPVIKEDIDGEIKKTCNNMVKGDAYKLIGETFPNLSKGVMDDIINLIEKEVAMDNTPITASEDIIKNALSKMAKSVQAEVELDKKPEAKTDVVDDQKDELQKALNEINELKQKLAEATKAPDAVVVDEVAKSVTTETLFPVVTDDFAKSITDTINASFSELKTAVDEKYDAQADLYKGLFDQITELNQRVTAFEAQPQPLRSITSTGYVQKSVTGDQVDQVKSNEPVLYFARDKQVLSELLYDKYVKDPKGESILDKALASDLMRYEGTNEVSPYMRQKCLEAGIKAL